MKHISTRLFLILALNVCLFASAQAQCVYTAISNGNFSSASTWQVSSSGCSPVPVSGSDANIVISGFTVAFDVDYTIGRNGGLTVQNSGVLSGGSNLNLGDGTGGQVDTYLNITSGSSVRVAQLTINKANVLIAAQLSSATAPTLTTDCNLVLLNSSIVDNSRAIINGSIDLTRGGSNNTLCGSGSVRIKGCVFGGNGATNRLASNCAADLVTTVCAQKLTTGCPGPLDATNASELECQNLASCPAPLPVELTAFTAAVTARKGVALHWVTASEKNSQSFVVERSLDGKSFRELLSVVAAGNTQSPTTYDQVDEQPLPGTSYYRLRQVDFDGTATYSPNRAVSMGNASGESLAVYPGRSAREWVVSSTLPAEILASGPATVRVFDALGRSQQVTLLADAAQPGRWTLNMASLPAGVYIVRLISAAGSFSQRIAQ